MWFRNNYCLNNHDPQNIIFSVPNEGSNIVEQIKKKGTGMMAGVSDLIMVIEGRVIFCEIKDDKGRQKPDQIAFEQKVTKLGHQYYLIRSLEEFKEMVEKELN